MKKFEEEVKVYGGIRQAAERAKTRLLPHAQDLSDRYDDCVRSLQGRKRTEASKEEREC